MSDLNIKAFVIPFYRSLLGFWILVLVFGGVFMELRQHILLGKFLFSHSLPFFILPIGFLLYSGFHLRFQMLLLRSREYQLFHQTALLPFSTFGKNWTSILLANHGIVLVYFVFLSFFGLEKKAWLLLTVLWFTIAVALACSILFIYRYLSRPLPEIVLRRPRWKKPLPRISWFVLELRQNRPILLLLTKALSLLLLNGFFLSFQSGSYDHRWLEFGVLCVAFFQIPILMEKNEFEISRMNWFLNLPSPYTQKVFIHLGTLSLVLFPELLLLFWKTGQQAAWENFFALPLMLVSAVLALLGLIYRFPEKSISTYVFATFFGFFLAILFGVHWIIPVLGSLAFFAFQVRSAYRL